MQGRYTFSNLSLTGLGFSPVILAAISCPMSKASSLVLPLSRTNTESVSPYTTLAPHRSSPSMVLMALSSVSLPLLTTLSPTSMQGMRPEKLAEV